MELFGVTVVLHKRTQLFTTNVTNAFFDWVVA